MCGITGFLTFTERFSKEDLQNMTNCISHRGPDADGFFFDGIAGMGHRRLSILDLTDAANQPMYSADGRYVTVYNGEVYNFQEIALNLNRKMKTTSDTEVILESFIQYGPDFVNQLNGMFAIAIYDMLEHKLFVFRDRMGIKPVYYYFNGEEFAFASELKSLQMLFPKKGELTLNKAAINLFLYLGYIPRPHSIYNEIVKMESGSYLVLDQSGLRAIPYWKLEEQIQPEMVSDLDSAKEQLKELILSSVKYRMISDVPFGTFLSGGIDSSLVTAAAQAISDKPVNTFSIGFEDAKFNEAAYAKSVADKLGTHHHEFTVTYQDAMELVDKLPDFYDEPFADSSAIPTYMVSHLARKHVTMTLSGDGGDELFFGYGMYDWARYLHNPFISAFRKPIRAGLGIFGDKYIKQRNLLNYPDRSGLKSHIFSQGHFYSEPELRNLVKQDVFSKPELQENWHVKGRVLNAMEEQALFDMKFYLQDDLLVKVDRATMRASLETRVPLLDYRIVKFALNVSPALKNRNGERKFLLKEVLYDFLPKELFDRPKAGFSIPLAKWLRGELRYLVDTYLDESLIKQQGILNVAYVQEIKSAFLGGNDYYYNRVWLLVVLNKWLSKNF